MRKNIEDSLKSDAEFDASLKDYKGVIRAIKENNRNPIQTYSTKRRKKADP